MAGVLTFLLQLVAVCVLGIVAVLVLYIAAVLIAACVKKMLEVWKK